jgi:hypothetical protein
MSSLRSILMPLALVASLSGCMSVNSYIDPALPTVNPEELRASGKPQPVHLMVEFRTKGAPNARGTELAKPVVLDTVRSTGLFSDVAESPVPGGRVLTIVIDNIEVTKDAAAKGFATGLTFGLAGSMVTDGYVCKATYTAPGSAPRSKEVNHALHTTIGNAEGPPGLKPMPPSEAFPVIVRQLTLNALRAIRGDGGL